MSPRTPVIAVAAVLLLAFALDFLQRVHVPRSPATREAILESPTLPVAPLSLAAAKQRLQSWFPPPTSDALLPPSETMSAPTDSGSRGPDRGDLGGWRFVLRGVFEAGPPFAVLEVMPLAGGEVERHQVSEGQVVNGIRVDSVSGRSVSLSHGEDVIDLALFTDQRNAMTLADE